MNEVLSSADVLRIAALSKVGVEAAEIERLRIDLGAVLSYMDVLRGMPEPALEGSTSETANRLGRDEPGPMLPREVFLAMVPAADGPFVSIPRVIGEGA